MFTIFLRELQDNLFGGKFVVSAVLMLITFLISLGMMAQEYDNRMTNHNDSLSLPAQELFWNKVWFWEFENGGYSNSDTITFPMGVVKKPEPLLFIARGMDKQMRQSVEFMDTFPIIDINTKPEQEANLLKLVFSAPDLLFMMKVLVSLIALLFSFNLICAERENGTLKLLMVNGVSRTSIFLGKYLGGLLSIWIAFTVAFIVYFLALGSIVPAVLGGEISLRVVFVFLISLVHIAIFFGLGALVSTFFRNSAPALIMALFLWLVVVFALPGFSSLLAQQFVKVDSHEKISRMKLEKAQEMEEEYSKAHPEDNRISNTGGYGRRHDAIREQITEELAKIDADHQRQKQLQATLTTSLARISPIGSLSYVYSSLCRNGIIDAELYQQDLHRKKVGMNDYITSMLNNPELGALWMSSKFDVPESIRIDALNSMQEIQSSEFSSMTLRETLSSLWLDVLLMVVIALILLSASFTRFMFYDPR